MDFCHNISLSGSLPAIYPPEQDVLCSLDDLLSGHSVEQVDVNMEWLSIFVEDCLSSSGNCIPPPLKPPQSTISKAEGTTPEQAKVNKTNSMLKIVVPSKARSKIKRSPKCWSKPKMLHQHYWLAESDPKKCTTHNSIGFGSSSSSSGQGQGRKCTHCLSQRTPQWRAGPKGPKTLCNACGVRYKSGRLLPEYRPAKSPTFVNHKHSNSHKKVLEMRMSIIL